MKYWNSKIIIFALTGILCLSASSAYAKTAEEYLVSGSSNLSSGNLTQAISDFSKAIEINPNFAGAYAARGLAYYGKGNYLQAASDYTQAIALNTPGKLGLDLEEIYNNRAVAYFRMKEYDKAWDDVHKAEALGFVVDPKFLNELKRVSGEFVVSANQTNLPDSKPISKVDVIQLKNGRSVEGIILKEDSKSVTIGIAGGEMALDKSMIKDVKKSETVQIKTSAPEIPAPYVNKPSLPIVAETAEEYSKRGLAYYKQANYVHAISDFSKAIEINPNSSADYINRGLSYYKQGSHDQAASDFDKAIKINPNSAEAYFNRALYGHGFLSDFDKAIEINPNYVAAYIGRAGLYYLRGDYDKAWQDVHKLESLGGSNIPSDFIEKLKKASGRER